MKKNKFISDKYREARGGWTRTLSISCKSCNKVIFYYQKDGSGPLKRSYLDRAINYEISFSKDGFYYCPRCKVCLGIDEPYKKEDNRPAVRWLSEAIKYQIVKQSSS